MKHSKLAKVNFLYENKFSAFLREFIRTHIKMAFFPPKNSILFSQRQYLGEKFILKNKNLFPYNYNTYTNFEMNQPLVNSQIVVLRINENINMKFLKLDNLKIFKQVADEVEIRFKNLNNTISFTKEEELDFPVSFYANFLYSIKKVKEHFNIQANVKQETIQKALNLFIAKIRFSDFDSVALVINALEENDIRDPEVWRKVLERLEQTNFESEFTQVTNASPFLFNYIEVKEKKEVLFDIGVITYLWIKKAANREFPGTQEALAKFQKRVNEENFNSALNYLKTEEKI